MVELLDLKNDIVKVLFYFNIIALVVGIFVSSKTYFIIIIVVNLIFNGTFLVISRYSYVFQSDNGLFSKQFGKLGNSLNYFTNLGRKNG